MLHFISFFQSIYRYTLKCKKRYAVNYRIYLVARLNGSDASEKQNQHQEESDEFGKEQQPYANFLLHSTFVCPNCQISY